MMELVQDTRIVIMNAVAYTGDAGGVDSGAFKLLMPGAHSNRPVQRMYVALLLEEQAGETAPTIDLLLRLYQCDLGVAANKSNLPVDEFLLECGGETPFRQGFWIHMEAVGDGFILNFREASASANKYQISAHGRLIF